MMRGWPGQACACDLAEVHARSGLVRVLVVSRHEGGADQPREEGAAAGSECKAQGTQPNPTKPLAEVRHEKVRAPHAGGREAPKNANSRGRHQRTSNPGP